MHATNLRFASSLSPRSRNAVAHVQKTRKSKQRQLNENCNLDSGDEERNIDDEEDDTSEQSGAAVVGARFDSQSVTQTDKNGNEMSE